MAEMKSLTIKGKYYEIVDEYARNTIKRTYSIFYADTTVPYPMEEGDEITVAISKLSNEGSGVKVGDLAVASNGALCKVIAVAQETGRVTLFAIASIGGSANTVDIVKSVLDALPTWTGGSY